MNETQISRTVPRRGWRWGSSRLGAVAATVAVTVSTVAVPVGSASAAGGNGAREARFERAVVAHLNRERREGGLAPVRVVRCVDRVAEERVAAVGRRPRPARVAGLVMNRCNRPLVLTASASGRLTPAAALQRWLESEAASVLLGKDLRGLGVGARRERRGVWHVSLVLVGERATSDAGGDSSNPGSGTGGTDGSGAGGGTGGDGTGGVEQPATDQPAEIVALQDAILAETNRRRANHDLPALKASACATGFAVGHSRGMADSGDFAHADLDDLRSECSATGATQGAAENIAMASGGALDPKTLLDLWMASKGHRANILNPQLTHLGVGVAYADDSSWYATQDFLDLT